MEISIVNILKFLFPEYQIVQIIKERGFIAKNMAVTAQSQFQTSSQTGGSKSVQWQSDPASMLQSMQSSIGAQAISAIVGGGSTSSKNTYVPATADEKIMAKANEVFAQLHEELEGSWVGAEADRIAICKAFQRPYVRGFDNSRPRNAILFIGPENSGKTYAVSCISSLLKQNGIFRYDAVSKLDINDYSSDTDNAIFLSDLYKNLNNHSETIVFKNIEKATAAQLDIIYSLLSDGTYKLSKRYMMKDGSLVEMTGVFDVDSISEIASNGKFFVFATTAPETKIISMLGNKIVKLLGDIIKINPIEDEQVKDLTATLLASLFRKCKDNLHAYVVYNDDLKEQISSHYKTNLGVKGLNEFVDEQIYGPLSEMKLQGLIADDSQVNLRYDNGFYIENAEGKTARLSDYTKNYKAFEIKESQKELDNIVGLSKVKEYVRSLENNFKVQKMREGKGMKTSDVSMHMIFAGNPGTGKTTIARIVAKNLKSIGVLSSGHLCEVTRADLVGQYAGHTAIKTTNVIKNAVGGVLFIDEAYSLNRSKEDAFGLEAIDALVKGMEDYRDDLVVILAGYKEEMEEFLNTNPGLRSRFPNIVEFEDYTSDEMLEIAKLTASSKGYKISDDCKDMLKQQFEKHQIKGKNDSGNGRLVRNMIEAAIIKQSKRIMNDSSQDMELLIPDDFGIDEEKEFDLEKELSKVIGLSSVKKYISSLNARLKLQAERKKAGLKTDDTQTMHMIFAGNPGTGKTMMARTIADVLYNMGVIPTNKLVETDRSGLVAGYVGQTAIKTRQVIESALGGVLFIDEAYTLAQGSENDFGQEAIDTLMKMMDDNRESLVVILAGYSDEMEGFLGTNPGLRSRFANIIEFSDYSTDELMDIANVMYSDKGYELSDTAKEALRDKFELARKDSKFSNARYVRNIIESSLNNQAMRLSKESNLTKETLITVTDSDVMEA
ncbi:AAA family ATPase [Butyrivibrio sp. X503]|uniref:AAA family ATPase n=1 Tax=Butyrivibrio sp. X503 TaxID=2364878 RepID=UPI000EA97A1F|nr:AAA family ATPase [Butyrivibrio sp. X503]RKM55456.1 AAA family ATPase [Butyrivibrio sp. X503]